MYFKLQKNKELNSKVNKFYKKYSQEILDILLFGSTVKGKDKPKDLDILILFKNKENLNITQELKMELQKFNPEITIKTWDSLRTSNFQAREAFLSESFSLIEQEYLSKTLGFQNITLFKYELKGLTLSKRVSFQYALYGRDKKSGIIKELSLTKFSDSVILCPVENTEKLKEFFKNWNLKINSFPILIPERIII